MIHFEGIFEFFLKNRQHVVKKKKSICNMKAASPPALLSSNTF